MRWAAVWVAIAMFTAVPVSALPTTRAETPLTGELLSAAAFRERLAAAITRAHAAARIDRVGDMSLRITEPGRPELQVNIDNAYAHYRDDPAALEEIVARYASLADVAGEGDATIDQLVAIVRPSDYILANTLAGADRSISIPPRPMAGDLSFFLAVDSPQTIRTVTTADLAVWKINVADAWSRALANIQPRVGPLAIGRLENDPQGSSVLGAESGLAPSLLAVICDDDHPNGMDGQIVLLYSKDNFLFGMPVDQGSVANFWRTAKRVIAAKEAISSTPLTCRQGRWTVATIP